MRTILTLDLGTTYFKVCLFDEQGRLRARSRMAAPIRRTPDGRCEMPAGRFVAAVRSGIRGLLAGTPCGLRSVSAVAVATQTNSFLLLDERHRPLTPLLLWPDRRAEVDAPRRRRWYAAMNALRRRTGVPAVTPQFMVAKLDWLRRHKAGIWSRARRLAMIGDYLTWWFTGIDATEAGAACLTGLCDIRTLRWIEPACERTGLKPDWMPAVVRAGTDLGPVVPERAEQLGLPGSTRFVVGCLDQYAGAIGVGNVHPGDCSETTGTVLSAVRCAARLAKPASSVFQGPAWTADRFYRMTFGSRAANLLERYRDQRPDRAEFPALDALAARCPPGARGRRLAGEEDEGTGPVAFAGGESPPDPGRDVRCILEGVAQALWRQVRELGPTRRLAEIRCAGGGARSDLWLQIKADRLGTRTTATRCPEPTSLGVAMLAARALGWADMEEIACRWVTPRVSMTPDPARHALYRRLYGKDT